MNGQVSEHIHEPSSHLPDRPPFDEGPENNPYYFIARSTVVQNQLAWEIRIRDKLDATMNEHLTELMHAITKSRMLEAKARAAEADAHATEAKARSFEAKMRAGLYVVPPVFAVFALAVGIFVLRVYGVELVSP